MNSDLEWNVHTPRLGEVVEVTNDTADPIAYTQRFVIFHNGRYYCERDDGGLRQLIGWKFCRKNVYGYEYAQSGVDSAGG